MVAPNLSALIGEVVGARLISHAGEVPLMLVVNSLFCHFEVVCTAKLVAGRLAQARH